MRLIDFGHCYVFLTPYGFCNQLKHFISVLLEHIAVGKHGLPSALIP